MKLPVNNVGTKGLNADTPPVLLEPQEWSDGRNVRFDNQSVEKMNGHVAIENTTVDPDFVEYWPRPNIPYYVYGNSTNIYRVDQAGTSTSIGTGFNVLGKWHASLFNGGFTVVLNNTLDTPRFITYQQDDSDTAVLEIPNWNYGGLTVNAGVVRSFGSVFVAGNLTISTPGLNMGDPAVVTRFPSTVRISTRAAPSQIPLTFEPGVLGDASTADEFELATTDGITEIAEISRGKAIIYTRNSMWDLTVSASSSRVNLLSSTYGCRNINCVTTFENQHFVVGPDDVYVHSGTSSIRSVIDGKFRDYLRANLHPLFFDNIFTQLNSSQDEIWICFPNLQSNCVEGKCNEALIWNYRQDTWTKRDLPAILDATQGPIPGAGIPRYRYVSDGDTVLTTQLDNDGNAIGNVAAGKPETFDAVTEIQTVTIDAITALNTDAAGEREVQIVNITGTRSNVATGDIDTQDSVVLTVRGDFNSGTTTTWSFDPDTTTSTPMIVDQVVTAADLNATQFITEVGTAIEALGDGATYEVIEDSVGNFEITTTVGSSTNLTITVESDDGPIGLYDATSFVGGTEAVTTGIDLVNNEGMLWVIPDGGDGLGRSTIIDTINQPNDVVLQPSVVAPQGGPSVDAFTTTGWTQDDFSAGSLNRTGALNTQLSFVVDPDLFDMVTYTGATGPNGDGTTAPHTETHNLGSVPGAMLVKAVDSSENWVFYHKDIFASGDVGHFTFNGVGVSNDSNNLNVFNGAHPTDSAFTIGNSTGAGSDTTNTPGGTYINYIFASNEISGSPDPDGNIFCGSYDGNGSSTLRTFTLGWRPTRLIIKAENNEVPTMAFITDASGVELTQYIPLDTNPTPATIDAFQGAFEDTSFRLATNSNLWNQSGVRYVYIAMRESNERTTQLLASDEPIFTGTAATLVVPTSVDNRSGGLTFFPSGNTSGVTPNILNNFGAVNQTGGATGSGRRARLAAFDTHDVQVSSVIGEADTFGSFQMNGLTLSSDNRINGIGRVLQAYSFADAPEFFSTTRWFSSGSASPGPNHNIAHTLGEVPQMVMLKRLTSAESGQNTSTQNPWNVWHRTTENSTVLSTSLNPTTGGDNAPNWLRPVGTTAMSTATGNTRYWTGGNADAYVMYAFGGKSVDGAASTVTTTDDGTLAAGGGLAGALAPTFVNLGWKPGFIMIKGISGATGFDRNWRYWSQEDDFTTVRIWNGSDGKYAGTVITATDNGFSIQLQNDADYIYWCSRDNLQDTSNFTTAGLYDIEGTLVNLSDADRTSYNTVATEDARAIALRDGVNNLTTTGVAYTATASGREVTIAADVYAHDLGSTTVGTITGTETVVDNTGTFDPARVGNNLLSGSTGSAAIEVALGTANDLTTTFGVTAGNGRNVLPTQADDEHVVDTRSGRSSQYTVADPSNTAVGMVISSSVLSTDATDATAVLDAIVALVNTSTDDMPINFDAVRAGNVITLTAAVAGVVGSTWTIVPRHENINSEPDGDLAFAIASTTTGTVSTALAAQPTINFTGPAGTNTYTFASRSNPSPLTATEVATLLRDNLTATGWTIDGAGREIVFTATTTGPKSGAFNPNEIVLGTPAQADVFAEGNFTHVETQPGLDEITLGTATEIVFRAGDVELTDPDSNVSPFKRTFTYSAGELHLPIITEIRTWLVDTLGCEFSTEPLQAFADDDTLTMTARAFTATLADLSLSGEIVIDVTQGSIGFKLAGQAQPPAGQALVAPLSFTQILDEEIFDATRPWRTDEYNLSRDFLVMAGSDDSKLFAADVSNQFDGTSFTAYVERKNFSFGDLESTKWVRTIYPLMDGTGTATMKMVGTNANGQAVNFNSNDAYSSVFDVVDDYKLDPNLNGRLISYRWESSDDESWRIAGLTFDYEIDGKR